MRRHVGWVLLIAFVALPGCKVVRYPSERVLPRPIPELTDELRRELAAEQAAAGEAGDADAGAGDADAEPSADVAALIEQAIAHGRALVGKAKVVIAGESYRADCSGFVGACFAAAGDGLAGPADEGTSGTEILYNAMARRGAIHDREIPRPGDLVFFSNTYDRNSNGRLDDAYTHVGFVEHVTKDGTVHFLHYVGGAVRIGRMNLLHPNDHADSDSGTIWNDYLRRRRKGDGPSVRYLTSQLWVGFGRLAATDE